MLKENRPKKGGATSRTLGNLTDEAATWAGVDLGGSRVRVVLSDEKGNFLDKADEKIDKSSAQAISKQISRITRSLWVRQFANIRHIRGMGIASAGPLKQKEGVLVKPPNIPFEFVPLTKPISRDLGIPVCLINDCAGAALGESIFGAAKDIEDFAYVTISTGIGCGAIVNGSLSLGKDGNAHEVGHFVIDYEGKLKCGCGRLGHWEAYCSGRNIPNFVRMRFEQMSPVEAKRSLLFTRLHGDLSGLSAADLFAGAEDRDDVSIKLVNELGILNAVGFANIVNAYDPALITVGGAVTLENKEAILSPVKKHVGEYAINRVPKIEVTPLGADVVLYGAVSTAIKYLS